MRNSRWKNKVSTTRIHFARTSCIVSNECDTFSALGFFPLYVTNEGGQEMFFFGIGMCEGRSSPVTGDTCAFFFFVDIYFTVVSRFSSKYGKKRFCGFAQFFVRHTAEVSWKI